MQVAAGVRLGSFEVRELLGAGGMGSVYRAWDPKLGREVAIKILQEKLEDRPDYLRRFEREWRSASALNHPNIVTIYAVDEFEGTPFIAMELVEGERLRDMLRGVPVPLRKLLGIASQIADGLAAAHDRGIVHRDIKPENVVITSQGLAKILDFGLARPELRGGADDLTGEFPAAKPPSPDDATAELITRGSGRLIGTAAYMSPEQASGRLVDFRSDQFSFGAVLYEMATGRRAFGRRTGQATIDAIVREEPEPAQRVNPSVPPPLCWIIERCLAKDPAERYASTRDLARELQTLKEHLSDATSGDLVAPHRITGRPQWRVMVPAAILAIMVIGGLAMLWREQRAALPAAGPHSVAVLPFQNVGGGAEGQLYSRGLAEAVSSRLAQFSSIQVIPPTSTAPLVTRGENERQIAQKLGATLLLNGTLQRRGDTLEVQYSLRDALGVTVANETVRGSIDNVWALRDQLSAAVARRLGAGQSVPPAEQGELETAEEQDLYLRALGNLQNHEDGKSVDAAIAQLRELLETASGSPLVHAALGRAYLHKYQVTKDRTWSEKAIAASDRSRALAPEEPDVLTTLASVQQFTGRFSESIETYKRALALQPNSAEAALGLAASYRGASRTEDAERAFQRAIALRPGWWSPHNELGVLYLTRGRYDLAEREFRKSIELSPGSVWSYSNLGIVYINKERLPEAVEILNKAISLREEGAAYGNLAYCYYYLGQYEKSAAAYRKAVQLKPKLATQWSNLADACRWVASCRQEVAADNEKAIELLREELAVNPKNARAQATLAVCLAKMGRSQEAQERIAEALAIEPENPARMFSAARVANFAGQEAQAAAWLRRAVDKGFGMLEIERDPEFRTLRESDPFRSAFPKTRPAA